MRETWQLTRRDLLWFLGGGTLGVVLSPLPWKLLDDAAIWTQSGSRIAKLPRGPLTTRFAHCPLCPAGCGLRVRCVGGKPVGLAGVAGHPRSAGKLCALGLAAHHLPFHRRRLTMPLARTAPGAAVAPLELDAAKALADAWLAAARRDGGRVALLDGRPGRAVSRVYRRWLAAEGGHYIPAPGSLPFAAVDDLVQEPWESTGVDLSQTHTLVIFGTAPGATGVAPGRWQAWRAADPLREVVCVGPRPPIPGSIAARWIPVRPGTEAGVALAIAEVLLDEHRDALAVRRAVDRDAYTALAQSHPPEDVAPRSGLTPEAIRDLARRLIEHPPAAVIANADGAAGPLGRTAETLILGLNFLLGSAGRPGGLVRRRERPGPQTGTLAPLDDLAAIPDGTLRFLILDACDGRVLPPQVVRRKLAPGARVVCLTPFATRAAETADLTLPAPAPFEGWAESPASWDGPVESYAVVPPLAPPRGGCIEPVEWLQELAGWPVRSLETLLRDEARAIESSRRGSIYTPSDGSTIPVASTSVWDRFVQGGCWIDEPSKQHPPQRFCFLGAPDTTSARERAAGIRARIGAALASDILLVPFVAQIGAAGGALPPVCAKLYRETGLLPAGGEALLHPQTGARAGLRDHGRAQIETPAGRTIVQVRHDATIPTGIVLAAVGPDPEHFGDPGEAAGAAVLRICAVDDELVWRATPARIGEA